MLGILFFQLAEVAVSRELFAAIMERITRLGKPQGTQAVR